MTTAPLADGPPAVQKPPAARRIGGWHLFAATAHLAAVGLIGPAIFSGLFSLLGGGIALVPALGVGLLLLVGLVYALYGVAWVEYARIDGLYHLGLPALPRRARTRPGFGGYLLALWHQFIDPAMWRGVASLAVSTVIGLIVVPLIAAVASGVTLLFAPLLSGRGTTGITGTGIEIATAWAPLAGALLTVLALAAITGLTLLHGVLTCALLLPSRTALLAAQARASESRRAGAVRASEVERTRIERDLHDGVQPRLVSVGMTLGLAQQKIDDDPAAAKDLIAEAHASTKAAITELRQLARGIHASVLEDRGLDAALSALAARSPIPVQLDVRLDGRCTPTSEAAVYFVIAESLTNAAKHSRASHCRVVVRVRDAGTLWARVEDDGIGGARVLPGGGLDGISNRVLAAGGSVRLDSPAGGPTSLEVSVPCAS